MTLLMHMMLALELSGVLKITAAATNALGFDATNSIRTDKEQKVNGCC
jgi:hypothetical protein